MTGTCGRNAGGGSVGWRSAEAGEAHLERRVELLVDVERAVEEVEALEAKERRLYGDGGDVKWNFEKFLVSPDGEVVARFRPKVLPDAEQVIEAIEAQLPR